MRPYTTSNQQIKILKQRGMNFKSISNAKKILDDKIYYNLINGFKDFFIDPNASPEHYINNVYFEEIVALSNFDHNLRLLFLNEILKIEEKFRSSVSRCFAKYEGSDKWDLSTSYDLSGTNKLTFVSSMINKLNMEASKMKNDSHDDMLNHFTQLGEKVPIWALINTFDFGTLRTFYFNMKQKQRVEIANKYSLTFTQLRSFLQTLNMYRNVCAHDFRILFYRIYDNDKKISNMEIHSNMHIKVDLNGNYIYGKNDLFSVVIIFRYMLEDKEFKVFYEKLNHLVKTLSHKLISINLFDIYESIGFPVKNGSQLGWRNILYVKK